MSVVHDIKSRLDIVDAVSGFVSLQKAGRNFKARCPFHTEKTPSFIVNPEQQTWRCFGACATGGDIFSFIMRVEGLDFGEALKLLAQKAGISLSRTTDRDRFEALHGINQEASRFFQDVLTSPQGRHGMRYLEERGVDVSARSTFGLGLSGGGRHSLKDHLSSLGFGLDRAVEAGLVHRGDDGSTRDFFWGRLMFPIHDRQGHIAGFGARSLDGSEPKYINTPRSPIFDKRSILYGLHLAAGAIKERDEAIVVEGYMDVIAAHQQGYANVVASMGTALTDRQVAQLKSMATDFVLAMDPDTAGQEATLRSLESSWNALRHQAVGGRRRSVGTLYQREDLNLRIAVLPSGSDPDRLIRDAPQEWERLVEEAVPWAEYCIPAIASKYDLSTPSGKAQAAEALFPIVASAHNHFEQENYLGKLASALGVTTDALVASFGGAGARRGGREMWPGARGPALQAATSPLSVNRESALEDYTLALLLSMPGLRERADGFTPEYFRKTENREVFTQWLRCTTIEQLEESIYEGLHDHLTYLTQKELAPADRKSMEAALTQCLQRLEERHLQEQQEALLSSEDASVPPPPELEQPIVSLNSRLKELFAQRNRGS